MNKKEKFILKGALEWDRQLFVKAMEELNTVEAIYYKAKVTVLEQILIDFCGESH
jgi:hypothetical protein